MGDFGKAPQMHANFLWTTQSPKRNVKAIAQHKCLPENMAKDYSDFELSDELMEILSDAQIEIGRKSYPRRYSRFKDLRPYEKACEWARGLDWRNNPYDRFLLRREILHHAESIFPHDRHWNVYRFASRAEIAPEVDRLMDEFPEKHERVGVFTYVMVSLPWNLASTHGLIQHSRLVQVLSSLRSQHRLN